MKERVKKGKPSTAFVMKLKMGMERIVVADVLQRVREHARNLLGSKRVGATWSHVTEKERKEKNELSIHSLSFNGINFTSAQSSRN